MKKIVCIVGPTAVGKTAIAFELANLLKGTLVSADSVQVFKGLDIISGKDLPEGYTYNAGYYSYNGSPSICLLDVVEPTVSFNATQYQKLASGYIDQIISQKKIPIIVGGTGLYIKSLTEGLDVEVAPDLRLRESLEKLSLEELQKLLPKEKIESLNASDIKNKRRLIRAVEILSGKKEVSPKQKNEFDSLIVGLKCDRETLKKRIDIRVDERLKNGGLEEVAKLFQRYDSLAQQVKDANGYKQLFQYFLGDSTFDEAIYRWQISEYRHAKNQMTWFEKYGNVEWYNIADNGYKN